VKEEAGTTVLVTGATDSLGAYPGARVEVEVVEAYRNMKEYLKDHPLVTEAAQEAVRRARLEPELQFVRGARTARASPSVAS
jgi:tripeptide aminopeptidase